MDQEKLSTSFETEQNVTLHLKHLKIFVMEMTGRKLTFNSVAGFVYVKHLLVFLATNIVFIGQLEKDIGRCFIISSRQ